MSNRVAPEPGAPASGLPPLPSTSTPAQPRSPSLPPINSGPFGRGASERNAPLPPLVVPTTQKAHQHMTATASTAMETAAEAATSSGGVGAAAGSGVDNTSNTGRVDISSGNSDGYRGSTSSISNGPREAAALTPRSPQASMQGAQERAYAEAAGISGAMSNIGGGQNVSDIQGVLEQQAVRGGSMLHADAEVQQAHALHHAHGAGMLDDQTALLAAVSTRTNSADAESALAIHIRRGASTGGPVHAGDGQKQLAGDVHEEQDQDDKLPGQAGQDQAEAWSFFSFSLILRAVIALWMPLASCFCSRPCQQRQTAEGEEDVKYREEYIPFSFPELREMLLQDFADSYLKDAEVQTDFETLCQNMALRNSLRLQLDFGLAHETYAKLDPDRYVGEPEEIGKESDDGCFGFFASCPASTDPPSLSRTQTLPRTKLEQQCLVSKFENEVKGIFEKAEFQALDDKVLRNALDAKSVHGLKVDMAPDGYLEHSRFYRGKHTKTVYQRLGMMFRLLQPVQPGDKALKGTKAAYQPTILQRFITPRVAASESLLLLKDDFLYLKLFKDVLECDVDMLLPGSIVKFRWFDWLVIWVPIAFGLGAALYKAATDTINFSTLVNALLSLFLIVVPIIWGIKAYMALKGKQRAYQADLNKVFLLHNLNNNAGVISQLISWAQEQEDNEAMLAYFFLWNGQDIPKPTAKTHLDKMVEDYVQGKMKQVNMKVKLDFEVVDAVNKLQRMGLLRPCQQADGHEMLQAVPLKEAVDSSDIRNFNRKNEVGMGLSARSRSRRKQQGAAGGGRGSEGRMFSSTSTASLAALLKHGSVGGEASLECGSATLPGLPRSP